MDQRSLEATPTWAISIVFLILVLLSLLIESALQLLTKFLKRRKRKALNRAVYKIKTELMQMGFISLLLTVGEVPISKICGSKEVGNSFLPCKDPESSLKLIDAYKDRIFESNTSIPIDTVHDSSCKAKGMVSIISREGIKQLHIFIFVLTIFHILYCIMTMCLGIAKMKRWKAWEEETMTLDYQITNDPRRFRLTRQTSFGRRHLKCWSNHPLLLWPVCFLRQFRGSVEKADYFTLRNGFIKFAPCQHINKSLLYQAHLAEGSNFNFQKFLSRSFDNDFEVVVGISFWIWIFSVFFIFFSAHVFYNYLWLPFIPLVAALVVGSKLQVIITKMCLDSRSESVVTRGTVLVKPNDNLFWFDRPQFLLHLIHFILFQNSFQMATLTWEWYEFGLRSCFHQETEDIVSWLVMGIIVQVVCGYVTLPLYALVTRMGSGIPKAVFTERVKKGIKHWHRLARHNLSSNKSSSRGYSSDPMSGDTTETSLSNMQELDAEPNHALSKVTSISPSEIIEVQPKATNGNFDGEISFGTSWRQLGSEKEIKVITSPMDGTNSEALELSPISI